MDVPWLRDPCPPAPFLSAHHLGAPGGPAGLVEVLPGVVAAADPGWAEGRAGTAPRARALAWATGLRSGVLVRLAAAWVWTGVPGLLPRSVRVAAAPDRVVSSAPPPDGVDPLVLAPARWCGTSDYVEVGGVAVTDPVTTAEECLRLERGPAGTRAVEALVSAGVVEAGQVRHALATREGARGRRAALARLDLLTCRGAADGASAA